MILAALSAVANYRQVCWAREGNGQSEAFKLTLSRPEFVQYELCALANYIIHLFPNEPTAF